MRKIKFWPVKDTHKIRVEVSLDAVKLEFEMDLGEAYDAEDDLRDALNILARTDLAG